jgi:hypothetical protein
MRSFPACQLLSTRCRTTPYVRLSCGSTTAAPTVRTPPKLHRRLPKTKPDPDTHHQALRALGNRLVGVSTAAYATTGSTTNIKPGHTAKSPTPPTVGPPAGGAVVSHTTRWWYDVLRDVGSAAVESLDDCIYSRSRDVFGVLIDGGELNEGSSRWAVVVSHDGHLASRRRDWT